MRRLAVLSAIQRAVSGRSVGATPSSTSRPGPMPPTASPSTATLARRTRWITARMVFPSLRGKERVCFGQPVSIDGGRTMADLSPHQQKIVKRYYENIDATARQKLAEL